MLHSLRLSVHLPQSSVFSRGHKQTSMHLQLQVLHSQCLVLILIKLWHIGQFIRIPAIFWAWPQYGRCFVKDKCAAVGRASISCSHSQSLLGLGECARAPAQTSYMPLRCGVGHFCSYCRPQQSQVLVPRKPTPFHLICQKQVLFTRSFSS